MPLYSFTENYYKQTYSGISSYSRTNRYELVYPEDQVLLRNALNIQPGESILIVGAGFGWRVEELINLGLGPIFATDTSPWIQNNTQNEAASHIIIHNLDINSSIDRDTIRKLLNFGPDDKFKWGITEDVLPCLTDQECIDMSNNMWSICENVVHCVSIPKKLNTAEFKPLLSHNLKLGPEWKTLLPNDKIVKLLTDQVF